MSTVSQPSIDEVLDIIQDQIDILGASFNAMPTLIVTTADGGLIKLQARGVKYLQIGGVTQPPREHNSGSLH